MTAKEKIIRESWIAEIGEEKYNEVKPVIDEKGWLDVESDVVSFQLFSMIALDQNFEDKTRPYKLRPKSINL